MTKFFSFLLGLALIASACGVDRQSENALAAEETSSSTEAADDAGEDTDAGEAGTEEEPAQAADDDGQVAPEVPPLQPSDPPETGADDDVALDVDFGDEQWELTYGELNDVALSVWESEDFIRRGFGGAVPPGFYSTVIGEHLVGKVLERELASVGAEASDEDRQAARDSLLGLIESWYSDSTDARAEAETLLNDVPYLGFVADLQADQEVLVEAISGEGSAVSEVPCVSHILLEEETVAQEVLAELESGADFASLATERSTGPSGPTGGELGCAAASNYVPEFAAAVESAEVGAYIGPVETQFGWHVLVVTGVEEQPADPSVELNNRISETLTGASVEVDPLVGSWDPVALRIVEVPTESE